MENSFQRPAACCLHYRSSKRQNRGILQTFQKRIERIVALQIIMGLMIHPVIFAVTAYPCNRAAFAESEKFPEQTLLLGSFFSFFIHPSGHTGHDKAFAGLKEPDNLLFLLP